ARGGARPDDRQPRGGRADAAARRLARDQRRARRRPHHVVAAGRARLPGLRPPRRDGRDRRPDRSAAPMTRRHYLAVVAGSATLLAAFPLSSVFSQFSWFFYTFIAVILIVGTAMLVRTLRGPVWAQVLAMTAALLLYLTWAFPSGGELGRLI